jgi:hypothetical protein
MPEKPRGIEVADGSGRLCLVGYQSASRPRQVFPHPRLRQMYTRVGRWQSVNALVYGNLEQD